MSLNLSYHLHQRLILTKLDSRYQLIYQLFADHPLGVIRLSNNLQIICRTTCALELFFYFLLIYDQLLINLSKLCQSAVIELY